MTIPSTITAELTSLQVQVQAAQPLAQAPRATVLAIKLNAGQLVSDVQTALVASSLLDTWSSSADPASIVSGFLNVATTATDQANLAVMRGVVGRALSNVNQVPT